MKRMTAFLLTLILLCGFQAPASAANGTSDGGYGYINHDGEMVIEPQFDRAYVFSEGRALVFSGTVQYFGFSPEEGKYGFIDEQGNLVIDYQFEDARSFHDGISIVKKSGQYGVIDTNGQIVIDF